MALTFLTLTNNTIVRMNEVQLTSTTFGTASGVQVQCQNAVNEAIRLKQFKIFISKGFNAQLGILPDVGFGMEYEDFVNYILIILK